MLALAEAHREVDDVRTGQELAEAQRLGEILVIHPAALLHQRVMRPIDRTAEAGEADLHESDIEIDEPVDPVTRCGDVLSVAHLRRVGFRHRLSK